MKPFTGTVVRCAPEFTRPSAPDSKHSQGTEENGQPGQVVHLKNPRDPADPDPLLPPSSDSAGVFYVHLFSKGFFSIPVKIPWVGLGGVHFIVCSTFCLQNGFFQPTKWYGQKLNYKMVFSSLQNGMAQTRPYKMVLLCQLYWTVFFNKKIDIFIQKWSNKCIHTPRKTSGPFCRASTLSVTQLQGQFFKNHFVGFLPCHLFFLNFTNLM